MGESNSVAFQFNRVGAIAYPAKAASADAMMDGAIEAGAEDVESDVGRPRDPVRHQRPVRRARRAGGAVWAAGECQAGLAAQRDVTIDDPERAAALVKLLDALEDNDDVQTVTSNAEIPDDVMEQPGRLMVRLMGIDPGLRFTGWGVIAVDGNRLCHIADGVIATDSELSVPDPAEGDP